MRKRKPGSKQKVQVIGMVEESDAKALKAEAVKKGKTLSHLVRDILLGHLALENE